MKNVKCYGKKTAPPKEEKSFIRNFFEGNKSSDSSLLRNSSEDVLQQNSSEEDEMKSSLNIFEFPPLFGSPSVKSLTQEKESFSRRLEEKATHDTMRNKPIKKKKNVRRKPVQKFHYNTKYCKSLQPRWSEIHRHNLTVESRRTNKTTSRHQISKKRNLSKKVLKRKVLEENLSDLTKTSEEKHKMSFSSVSNILNSSGDLFIPSFRKTKCIKKKIPHLQGIQKLKRKQHNDSSASRISELGKKFEQSMKLGNVLVVPDNTLYLNEDLYTKSPLNSKSPVGFSEWNELQISGNVNTSPNFFRLLTTSDVSAEKTSKRQKEDTDKKLNSVSSIHVPQIFQSSSSRENTSRGKFVTSTPIIPKFKSVLYSVNAGSFHGGQKSTTKSSAFISKSSLVIPQSDKHIERENEENTCRFSSCNISSNKSRKSLYTDLSVLCCLNKSVTMPEKRSVNSVPSVNKRSLPNVSSFNKSLIQESVELTKVKLLELCNQDSVADFAEIYEWSKSKIKKIGEGSYGEVFMVTKGKSSCVLKIIPVSEDASCDYQGLQNVLSEVKISKCLSELRNGKRNQAKNFIKLDNVSLVSGIYPSVLINAWDNFRETKSSYNDRPDIFQENQMFVILELDYGGKDLSSCMLRNAVEAESVLKQIAVTLAVAEEEFVFEHRDLHLGNILIQRNRKKTVSYKLRGKNISFKSHGVHTTVIDFTLSRLCEDDYIYYNDLAQELSLFEQSGDCQFDVYKSMRKVLENQWQNCCLYSNVLWLKFLCKKMMEFEYSRPSTLAHKNGLKAIDAFNDQLIKCNSAIDCLTRCGITPIYFERSNHDLELTKKSILVSRNSIQKSKLSICN